MRISDWSSDVCSSDLRLGQPDLFDIPFVAAAGAAIFDNLGLLFALGIGVGLAKDNNGAAGLAGIVCFLVATRGSMTLPTVPPDTLAGLSADATALAADAWRTKAIAKLSEIGRAACRERVCQAV